MLTKSHFAQEIIEENICKLAEITAINTVIINNPHTIWSVANVLDLKLTKHQHKKAECLAYKIFNHAHPETEPESCIIFNRKVNHYVLIMSMELLCTSCENVMIAS